MRTARHAILLVAVAVFTSFRAAQAAERHVPSAYSTIQAAIDAAQPADEVIIAPGTYTGDGNRDLDFGGKMITVRGTNPLDPAVVAATVIDCQATSSDKHRGFSIHSGEGPESIVAGLTITKGLVGTTEPDPQGTGGGILCDGSSPTIAHCRFTSNSAGNGGGISCWVGGNPRIVSCTFSGSGGGAGGGISCISSGAQIEDCDFGPASVVYNAAGLWCDMADVTVIRSTFHDLRSASYGGAICCVGSDLTIMNCWITGNSSTGRVGGGICCKDSNLLLVNSRLDHNHADAFLWGDGGALAFQGSNTALIANCTFVANSGYMVGGFFIDGNYNPTCTISNCIAWGNTGIQISAPAGSVTYSDVQGGWTGAGNINADPLFVDPDGWDGDPSNDYLLAAGSPCIDRGNNLAVAADVADLDQDGNVTEPTPFDLNGNARFADDPDAPDLGNPPGGSPFVDMGAYERTGPTDSDGDGVPDAEDNCPNDPNSDQYDADDDDVGDACDDCPATVPGSPVDENGCPPLIPGDFDRDGDVEEADLDEFEACATGPGITQADPSCNWARLDGDADVDQVDFAVLQRCFSGEDVPADPGCTD